MLFAVINSISIGSKLFYILEAEILSKDMNYKMSVCTKSIKSLDVWVFLLKLIKSAVLPDKVDNPLSGC